MKALIFAAGLGTRLYPLTADRPKALVEVGGIPMLDRVISAVINAGVSEIVVNVHHFADKIIDHLAARDYGVKISVSDERDTLLETGGGLLKARPLLDGNEPILLHNADILTDLNLRIIPSKADATLLVADRQTSRKLAFDINTNRLLGWVNTATGETRPAGFAYNPTQQRLLAFNGIHIFSPRLFPMLEAYAREIGSNAFSITPFYLYAAEQGADIVGFTPASPYRWFDIGKPASLQAAEKELAQLDQ